MVGSCPECKGTLSTTANTCPHCGFTQKSSTPPVAQSPVTAPQGGSFLDPKKNTRALVRLLVVAVVLLIPILIAVYVLAGRKGAETLLKKVTLQPITLIDETFDVQSKAWQGRGFSIRSNSEVVISVNVKDGDGVNVYVIDESDIEEFKKASHTLFGGKFHHYPSFHSTETKQKTMTERVSPGGYYVVIQNDTWGIQSKPKFTVHLKVTSL